MHCTSMYHAPEGVGGGGSHLAYIHFYLLVICSKHACLKCSNPCLKAGRPGELVRTKVPEQRWPRLMEQPHYGSYLVVHLPLLSHAQQPNSGQTGHTTAPFVRSLVSHRSSHLLAPVEDSRVSVAITLLWRLRWCLINRSMEGSSFIRGPNIGGGFLHTRSQKPFSLIRVSMTLGSPCQQ